MLVGTLEAPLLQQQVGSREQQQQQCAPGDAQQHSRQLTMSSCYREQLLLGNSFTHTHTHTHPAADLHTPVPTDEQLA